MPRIIYTPEQKAEIIKKAKEIGATTAAKMEGVSYPTVLKWMKEETTGAVAKVKDVPKNASAALDAQIEACEAEIEEMTKELSSKRAELKSLLRARDKAEKAEAKDREARETEKLVKEILKSGRPIDEVLSLLSE